MDPLDPLDAFGDFPPELYRVSDEHWARELVEHGRLRLSRIDYFSSIEDSVRADASEGTAHQLIPGTNYKVRMVDGEIAGVCPLPGNVHLQIESLTPTYILSFSYPPSGEVAALPWKFGDVAVRISDPKVFAQEITNWLTWEGRLRGLPVVESIKVRYDKGEPSSDLVNPIDRSRLGASQKPRSYEAECEYRFIVLADIGAAEREEIGLHHHIDLGHPLPYAEVVRLPAAHDVA